MPRVPAHSKYQPVKLRDRVSCLRIKYYVPAAAWRMNQYVWLHLWFSSITSLSPITLFCVRLILSRLLLDLILNLRGFLKWLNLCSFGINVKFNAGFLLPADDRAVHLNFGGKGGGVDRGQSRWFWLISDTCTAFFSLINPNKTGSQSVTSEVIALEWSLLFSWSF